MADHINGPLTTTGLDDRIGWRLQARRLLALTWTDVRVLTATTLVNWYRHNVPRLGASVAFYTLLSLAPLIIIVVAVAGAVFGRDAAQGQLVWQISDLIGRDGAQLVESLIRGAQRPGAGVLASILGVLTLVYGATAVVSELRDALNTVWCVPRKEQTGWQSILELLIDRTVAFATVLGVGFLLIVSLAVNAALSAIGKRYHGWLPSPEYVLQSIDFVVSYVVIAFLFALIYKLLPDLRLEWRDVIPGALATSLLFSAGKLLIGMYLGKASLASTYGAAGSLVIVLVWVYYSAQIFFLGAEFTQAYAQRYGSRPCDRASIEVKVVSSIDKPEEEADCPPGDSLVKLS